ncbi:MAG: hypothetical protein JOZ39_08955 [Chloroflexi bacterium]|nr:hypothetical protein [Chloroflexota bacterium]
MARQYGRIRPVPDSPLEVAASPDFRMVSVVAGGLILAGFAVLCAMVYLAYFAFTQFLPSLTDARPAALSAVVGTVEVRDAGSTRWTVAPAGLSLQEGQVLRTRENSRAFVTLFDQSTITLYPLSEISLAALRTNRFGSVLHVTPRTVVNVTETSGRALFGVAHLNPLADLRFQVQNGDATANLSEGSYIVKVTPSHAFEVVTTRGSSVVSAAGKQVKIGGGERAQVRPNQPPDPPILAAEDLVTNGAFTQSDGAGKPANWDLVAPPPEGGDVPGQIRLTSDDSFPVVRFSRAGSTYHAEQSIRQVINQDVTDYAVVRLDLRFKIFSQSIPGGGDQGSEYPLMVRVSYLDGSGAPGLFVRGFYVQNDRNAPVTNGQQVKAGEWVNLSDATGLALQQLPSRPQFIQSIEIVASGHDYDSEIQRVSLVIE